MLLNSSRCIMSQFNLLNSALLKMTKTCPIFRIYTETKIEHCAVEFVSRCIMSQFNLLKSTPLKMTKNKGSQALSFLGCTLNEKSQRRDPVRHPVRAVQHFMCSVIFQLELLTGLDEGFPVILSCFFGNPIFH